jgi:hypothetical protein
MPVRAPVTMARLVMGVRFEHEEESQRESFAFSGWVV